MGRGEVAEPVETPSGYDELLWDIKARVQAAPVRAALAVNEAANCCVIVPLLVDLRCRWTGVGEVTAGVPRGQGEPSVMEIQRGEGLIGGRYRPTSLVTV